MDYYKLYIFLSFAIGVIGLIIGSVNFFLNEGKIEKAEKFCRERNFGVVIFFGCLSWCVPHTEVIIFNFLVPYLWYIAIILAVLSYFYLDYLIGAVVRDDFEKAFDTVDNVLFEMDKKASGAYEYPNIINMYVKKHNLPFHV